MDNSELSSEAKSRLFQHGLHEEGVFYNRLNFFLVFESLLFAATMTVLSEETAMSSELVKLMVWIGIIVSVVWAYAQLNKLVLLKTLEKRALDACPEFAETVRLANEHRYWIVRLVRSPSANTFLAWFFPALFLACWIAILAIRAAR